MRWGLVLALGIIAVAIGVFFNAYATAVVESGPFPAKSAGYQIGGFFFIGLGMGYLVLVPLIRNLENKIRKMEKEPF
jgi:hypothetical protein